MAVPALVYFTHLWFLRYVCGHSLQIDFNVELLTTKAPKVTLPDYKQINGSQLNVSQESHSNKNEYSTDFIHSKRNITMMSHQVNYRDSSKSDQIEHNDVCGSKSCDKNTFGKDTKLANTQNNNEIINDYLNYTFNKRVVENNTNTADVYEKFIQNVCGSKLFPNTGNLCDNNTFGRNNLNNDLNFTFNKIVNENSTNSSNVYEKILQSLKWLYGFNGNLKDNVVDEIARNIIEQGTHEKTTKKFFNDFNIAKVIDEDFPQNDLYRSDQEELDQLEVHDKSKDLLNEKIIPEENDVNERSRFKVIHDGNDDSTMRSINTSEISSRLDAVNVTNNFYNNKNVTSPKCHIRFGSATDDKRNNINIEKTNLVLDTTPYNKTSRLDNFQKLNDKSTDPENIVNAYNMLHNSDMFNTILDHLLPINDTTKFNLNLSRFAMPDNEPKNASSEEQQQHHEDEPKRFRLNLSRFEPMNETKSTSGRFKQYLKKLYSLHKRTEDNSESDTVYRSQALEDDKLRIKNFNLTKQKKVLNTLSTTIVPSSLALSEVKSDSIITRLMVEEVFARLNNLQDLNLNETKKLMESPKPLIKQIITSPRSAHESRRNFKPRTSSFSTQLEKTTATTPDPISQFYASVAFPDETYIVSFGIQMICHLKDVQPWVKLHDVAIIFAYEYSVVAEENQDEMKYLGTPIDLAFKDFSRLIKNWNEGEARGNLTRYCHQLMNRQQYWHELNLILDHYELFMDKKAVQHVVEVWDKLKNYPNVDLNYSELSIIMRTMLNEIFMNPFKRVLAREKPNIMHRIRRLSWLLNSYANLIRYPHVKMKLQLKEHVTRIPVQHRRYKRQMMGGPQRTKNNRKNLDIRSAYIQPKKSKPRKNNKRKAGPHIMNLEMALKLGKNITTGNTYNSSSENWLANDDVSVSEWRADSEDVVTNVATNATIKPQRKSFSSDMRHIKKQHPLHYAKYVRHYHKHHKRKHRNSHMKKYEKVVGHYFHDHKKRHKKRRRHKSMKTSHQETAHSKSRTLSRYSYTTRTTSNTNILRQLINNDYKTSNPNVLRQLIINDNDKIKGLVKNILGTNDDRVSKAASWITKQPLRPLSSGGDKDLFSFAIVSTTTPNAATQKNTMQQKRYSMANNRDVINIKQNFPTNLNLPDEFGSNVKDSAKESNNLVNDFNNINIDETVNLQNNGILSSNTIRGYNYNYRGIGRGGKINTENGGGKINDFMNDLLKNREKVRIQQRDPFREANGNKIQNVARDIRNPIGVYGNIIGGKVNIQNNGKDLISLEYNNNMNTVNSSIQNTDRPSYNPLRGNDYMNSVRKDVYKIIDSGVSNRIDEYNKLNTYVKPQPENIGRGLTDVIRGGREPNNPITSLNDLDSRMGLKNLNLDVLKNNGGEPSNPTRDFNKLKTVAKDQIEEIDRELSNAISDMEERLGLKNLNLEFKFKNDGRESNNPIRAYNKLNAVGRELSNAIGEVKRVVNNTTLNNFKDKNRESSNPIREYNKLNSNGKVNELRNGMGNVHKESMDTQFNQREINYYNQRGHHQQITVNKRGNRNREFLRKPTASLFRENDRFSNNEVTKTISRTDRNPLQRPNVEPRQYKRVTKNILPNLSLETNGRINTKQRVKSGNINNNIVKNSKFKQMRQPNNFNKQRSVQKHGSLSPAQINDELFKRIYRSPTHDKENKIIFRQQKGKKGFNGQYNNNTIPAEQQPYKQKHKMKQYAKGQHRVQNKNDKTNPHKENLNYYNKVQRPVNKPNQGRIDKQRQNIAKKNNLIKMKDMLKRNKKPTNHTIDHFSKYKKADPRFKNRYQKLVFRTEQEKQNLFKKYKEILGGPDVIQKLMDAFTKMGNKTKNGKSEKGSRNKGGKVYSQEYDNPRRAIMIKISDKDKNEIDKVNKKDLLRKITELSSYSDEEIPLKQNLYNALHGKDTRKLFRTVSDEIKVDINEVSASEDIEHVLKENIYKTFGYDTNLRRIGDEKSELKEVSKVTNIGKKE